MEKERVLVLAQILASMKEAAVRIGQAFKNEDAEQLASAKKELLALQAKVDGLL